jgi:hypothetical protein
MVPEVFGCVPPASPAAIDDGVRLAEHPRNAAAGPAAGVGDNRHLADNGFAVMILDDK